MIYGAVFVVAATLVTACGSSSSSTGTSTDTKGSGGVSTNTAKGTPVSIDLGDTKGTDGPMTMTISPASVPAGAVTFTVKNSGTIKHEMVVLKSAAADLVVGADGKVSEASSVGEVGDVLVGKTGSKTLTLKAGTYEIVCNIKDHFKLGMHATLTVT
jgi:uncharacterized cupredoxin-like copper-binding protein